MTVGTLPPNLLVASGGHQCGRQSSVQRWVPLQGDFRLPRCQIVESGQHLSPSAIGTATAGGAGRYGCLVFVAQRTAPPHLAVGIRRDGLRSQGFILLRMPLPCQVREAAGQIIFTWYDRPTHTDRTARTVGTGYDARTPFMPFFTDPPDLATGTGHEIAWCQATVLCGMPLLRKLRMGTGKIVDAAQQRSVRTNRTAAAAGSALHDCPPFVTLFTDPPHGSVAPHGDTVRGQRGIFRGMPLRGKRRVLRRQIVFSGADLLSGAERASGVSTCPGIDCRLPFVSLFAAPPDLLFAAVGSIMGSEGGVLLLIPLGQQSFSSIFQAEVI